MPRFQTNISYHSKNQKKKSQTGWKIQSKVANPKMKEMLELFDKDLKVALKKILSWMTNMLETNEKNGNHQQRNRKFQQRHRKCKKEPKWKYKNQNKSLCGWAQQQNEGKGVKIHQWTGRWNNRNYSNREKIDWKKKRNKASGALNSFPCLPFFFSL